MLQELEILKGVHPGFVLDRKIREMNLRKGQLALAIREYPQTITSITKGRRGMNTELALKLEKALGLEEGYFMVLQVFYDIKQAKKREEKKPDLTKFRKILFWDTDFASIDWVRQYKAIILRVIQRGNEQEKKALIEFYGQERVQEVIAENLKSPN
ncbi:HigA family addiction module antitoxin [Pseudobacter ginsenosidimutans]|uniref:HigA family addiction module antitoxin n=1 Tax=Pseudobacter ginsenosidimutans TaxID=661488 RepID=UPI00102DC437|nr:HigA family addiction module antitoxin [Pseudobacter ginsenosidimutans]QEC40283.1 HigA family addiction module antidote protein [Pseudobacter ginsenosidimutans]